MSTIGSTALLQPVTHQQAETLFNDALLGAMQAMCRDTFHRLNNYKSNPELLRNGVYYGNDYYLALKDARLNQDLEDFKNKGSFYHGYASPNHFTHVADPSQDTGFTFERFTLNLGVNPNEAMESLDQGPTLISCGSAQIKCYYAALRVLLGEDKFREIFRADSETPLVFSDNPATNTLSYLFEATDEDIHKRGARVYFNGIPDYYCIKHINGEARGYNVFALGNGKFVGFGLNPEGATKKEIHEHLMNEYNRSPLGFAAIPQDVALKILNKMLPAMRQNCVKLKNDQIDIAEYRRRGGGMTLHSGDRVSYHKVAALMNATIPEAKVLMSVWKKSFNLET